MAGATHSYVDPDLKPVVVDSSFITEGQIDFYSLTEAGNTQTRSLQSGERLAEASPDDNLNMLLLPNPLCSNMSATCHFPWIDCFNILSFFQCHSERQLSYHPAFVLCSDNLACSCLFYKSYTSEMSWQKTKRWPFLVEPPPPQRINDLKIITTIWIFMQELHRHENTGVYLRRYPHWLKPGILSLICTS